MMNEYKTGSSNKTVVVLGAGRSGTSLLCGILSILGVDFGKRLIPADVSNPRGYFENSEFIKLNEGIYTELKKSDDMHALSFSEIEPYFSSHDVLFKNLICDLLYSRVSDLYGLKAWRVPLIELAMPHLVNPMFVVIDRNKDDTARSLKLHLERRKDHRAVSFEECQEIIDEYRAEVERVIERHPSIRCIRVAFEELMEDVESVTRKLADFMRVPLTEEKTRQARNFVLPSKSERQKMARKAALLLPFRRVSLAVKKRLFRSA